MTQTVAQARAEMVALCASNIKHHTARLQTARDLSQYVIFTGSEDCPVWVNEESVKTGKFSIGLGMATRYVLRADAELIAAHVRNGHGQQGQVRRVRAAHELEIATNENMIAQLGNGRLLHTA